MGSAPQFSKLGTRGLIMILIAITTDKAKISSIKIQIIIEEVVGVALVSIEVLTTQVGSIKTKRLSNKDRIPTLIIISRTINKTIILISSRKKTISKCQVKT